jgi:glutathione synthase/RimK-type ligase-like ATP-grasp enzyme
VTLEAVRFFAKRGYRVLGAESSPRNLARSSRYLAGNEVVTAPRRNPSQYVKDLGEICVREKVDVLIPTCEEVFYVSSGKKELEALGVRVFADDLEKLRLLHNKFLFNQWTQGTSHPGPSSLLVTSQEQLEELRNSEKMQVLKPAYSRFGSAVKILRPGERGWGKGLQISADHPWVLQDFVAGEEICFYGICHRGRLAHSVCYQSAFRAGPGAGICFREVKRPDVTEWAREVAQKLSYHGQISFDVIAPSGENFFPLECNPRATSGLHLMVEDESLEALVNEAWTPAQALKKDSTPAQVALAMLFLGAPQIRSWSALRNWLHCYWNSRDVLKERGDWGPLWGQVAYLFQSLSVGRTKGISLLEATTEDIQWDGESLS